MRIAVIDSGINPHHPHVGGVAGGVWIGPHGESSDYLDRLGHGTAVAGAIREKAPDAELFAVKVFDRALSAGTGAIIRALEWAMAQRVDVINLSLGTRNPDRRARFEAVLARAPDVVVVSAFEHQGGRLLPGSLRPVIGVMLDPECPRDAYGVEMRNGRPVFFASGFPRSIPGVPPEKNLNGPSFAVANMTGFVARALAGGLPRAALEARLIECARESRVSKGVFP
jgi:subtilisin family serine protease